MPERVHRWMHTGRMLAVAALLIACSSGSALAAGGQQDPELGPILRAAIDGTGCDEHADHYDEEVWFKLQEPRMRAYVKDPAMRVAILQHAYCETNRVILRYREEQKFALRLTPELVLAVMDVESRFDRYAVSSAGAVGLMQIMPFWPRELGVENKLFGSVEFNIRMGVEILAFYMKREKNDYIRALARYNGSLGRRTYSDVVLDRLYSRWRSS